MRKPVPFGTPKSAILNPELRAAHNKELCVAQYANGRKRIVPALVRLEARRADFDKGATSLEAKVRRRWETKGYHRPGSVQ